MRILVCGASGFIGSHLANYLLGKGHYVRAMDVRLQSECRLTIPVDKFIVGDLREVEVALKASKDIDWVFQLAANMGGMGYLSEHNADVQRDNVLINVNVLEACRKNNVDRIFFSSSACIYNRLKQMSPDNEGLREGVDDIPAWPDSAYGWEKLFSEQLYQSYRKDYGLPIRIARFHNIYGQYCDFDNGREKAPAALCRKVALAEDGDAVEVWGDGKQTRSFTYIDDCIEGIWRIMNSDYEGPLNLGMSELVSIDELAHLITEIAGKKIRLRHDLGKPQGVRGRNADLELMRLVLKWEPKTPLRDGLKSLYEWVEGQIRRVEA